MLGRRYERPNTSFDEVQGVNADLLIAHSNTASAENAAIVIDEDYFVKDLLWVCFRYCFVGALVNLLVENLVL